MYCVHVCMQYCQLIFIIQIEVLMVMQSEPLAGLAFRHDRPGGSVERLLGAGCRETVDNMTRSS